MLFHSQQCHPINSSEYSVLLEENKGAQRLQMFNCISAINYATICVDHKIRCLFRFADRTFNIQKPINISFFYDLFHPFINKYVSINSCPSSFASGTPTALFHDVFHAAFRFPNISRISSLCLQPKKNTVPQYATIRT